MKILVSIYERGSVRVRSVLFRSTVSFVHKSAFSKAYQIEFYDVMRARIKGWIKLNQHFLPVLIRKGRYESLVHWLFASFHFINARWSVKAMAQFSLTWKAVTLKRVSSRYQDIRVPYSNPNRIDHRSPPQTFNLLPSTSTFRDSPSFLFLEMSAMCPGRGFRRDLQQQSWTDNAKNPWNLAPEF